MFIRSSWQNLSHRPVAGNRGRGSPLYNRAGHSRHRRIIGSPLLHTPAVPCRSPARAASADYRDLRRITEPGWSCSVGFLRNLRLGIVLGVGFWGFNREKNEWSCAYPGLLTPKKVWVCKCLCLFHSKNRVNLPRMNLRSQADRNSTAQQQKKQFRSPNYS